MLPEIRQRYNASFTEANYQAFVAQINEDFPNTLEFRVAETPAFIPKALTQKLVQAGEDIIDVMIQPDFKAKTERAIPADQRVPNEPDICTLLTLDFAVCKDDQGEYTPQLIEMQGFATLYGYQAYIGGLYKRFFYCPEGFTEYFHGLDREGYIAELHRLFIGDGNAENTILLEIYPEIQKTRIDFAVTKDILGIEPVCLTKVRKDGRKLYYEKDGRRIDIQRIYNRVIFDDLQNYPDLVTEFKLTDDVDVEWIAHPNWFYRASKFTLPLLDSPFVPKSYFLHELPEYPADLENYVLKPLFSFAGSGVKLHITVDDLDAISDKENFLLQRKVNYEPVVESPTGGVKLEIRLMYVWHQGEARPNLITNLSRMSKGEMIGVRFNKNFDWVGGNICFFEE
ncbi:hypothetical protein [Haliscomenobacter sp.]|uniref:hypothetical protein n=1 Tax=Haliscomenobacter sp. TaxID=2717303 RepID=UPI0035934805